MDVTVSGPRRPASYREVVLWYAVTIAAEVLVYPGLGVVMALVLAFTRLRHNGRARWVLVGVSAAILAFQLVGLLAVGVSGGTGPEQLVG
jgi:hypothetical protein